MDPIDAAILTVVREHHWPPEVINGLYLDDIDRFGLFYWDNDVRKCIEDVKQK